jgi:uncharacterized protein (DUF1330 family)
MAKAYWVVSYRAIHNPEVIPEYAKVAALAVQGAGGRFVARGNAVKAYEGGQLLRTVVVEFDSLEKAVAAYESPAYQAAVRVLGNAVDRDFRIVEGA